MDTTGGLGKVVDQPSPDKAAELLAKLLSEGLGVNTDASAVKRLIRERWSKLSPLAHAVHNGAES